ncbi:MAG: MCP four helix bundle domain-containing protein, partial [Nitrospirae bacterium]|nr:MCP four helix bundle domain-containing protein [Nitrospirota bacterium]
MKWFYDLKISSKLLMGFVLVALIAGTIGYIGINDVGKLAAANKHMYEDMTVPVGLMAEVTQDFQRIRVATRDILLSEKPEERLRDTNTIKELREKIDKTAKEYEGTFLDDTDRANFKEFTYAKAAFRPIVDRVIELATTGKQAEGISIMQKEMVPASRAEEQAIEKVIAYNLKVAKDTSDRNQKEAKAVTTMIIAFTIGGMFLALILGLFIARLIARPLRHMVAAADRLALGDVDIEIVEDTKDEVGVLAQSLRRVIENISESASTAQRIVAGDLGVEVKARSAKDVLGKSMLLVVETLRNLVAEAAMLTKAAIDGRLATRGNAERFNGGYREIVTGVNKTLDAVIGPLNVAANYVERISKGDIPTAIVDTYNGDFNTIKNNLNACIANINALVGDANTLVEAAVAGKLATRADAARHSGDYRKIVDGVNKTLDAVIGPLNVAANYVERISKGDIPEAITDKYHGDFNTIKGNLNACIANINALVVDANTLVEAAVAGKLA